MKFKAQPNLYVKILNKYIQKATGIKGVQFDAQGEYETENEVLINALSQSFETVSAKRTPEEPPAESPKEPQEEPKKIHCKKCDFVTDNKGLLMQHYKKDHPKEG